MDASAALTAEVSGPVELLGFGSGSPITDENYHKGAFTSHHGRALAVPRSGFEAGEVHLTVRAEGFGAAEIILNVEE